MQASSKSISSISILGNSTAICDALATAGLTFSDPTECQRYFDKIASKNTQLLKAYWIYTRSGDLIRKAGFSEFEQVPPKFPYALFRKILSSIPRLVSVVTCRRDDLTPANLGMTASSLMIEEFSDKTVVSFNINNFSHMGIYIKGCKTFCVNILRKSQVSLLTFESYRLGFHRRKFHGQVYG